MNFEQVVHFGNGPIIFDVSFRMRKAFRLQDADAGQPLDVVRSSLIFWQHTDPFISPVPSCFSGT